MVSWLTELFGCEENTVVQENTTRELHKPSGGVTTVALLRVEGILVGKGAPWLTAYLAANAYGLGQRLRKIGEAVVMAPWYGILGQTDRTLATRLAYVSARDMSEDRLAILCGEYFDSVLLPSLLDDGVELLERVHRQGHEIVLVSETLRPA